MLHILVQFKSTKQFKITVCVNTNVYVHFTVLHVCVHTVSVTVCVCVNLVHTVSGCVDHSHNALCGLDCAAAPRSHSARSHRWH